MPVALDPNARIDVWLPADEKKPPETRPTFFARFLTVKETLAQEQAIDAAHACKTNAETNVILTEALTVVLVGWRNIVDRQGKSIDFGSAGLLDEVLTVNEKWKLVYATLRRTQLTEEERGKSGLPQA